jgi:hypothetical protein
MINLFSTLLYIIFLVRASNRMGQSHLISWDTFEKLLVPWDGMTFKSHGISSYFILEKDNYIQMSHLIIGRKN